MSNTVIRRTTSALQMNEFMVALSGLRMTADQCSCIVQGLAGCLDGDDYEYFGSINLDDVAETMQMEIEAFNEPRQCGGCSGSGEGHYDGTRCGTCGGCGELPSQREIQQLEGMES